MTPSGEEFDTPWTDLGALLDPMLAPCWAHVGPMLAPCWRPLDVLGHLGAFLEGSGAHLEAIFDQHRTEGEKKRPDSHKIIKKPTFFVGFLKFPRFQHEASWGCFWGHLGGLGAILGAYWASWGALGGVLTASWDVWECLGTLRSI